jgi:hypothetical protein
MVSFQEVRCAEIFDRLPGVVARRVTLPLYEILQGPISSKETMTQYVLDFVLFFSSNEVGGGSREVGAVRRRFSIR